MHFVILFSVCMQFGGTSGCDMCNIQFGNLATCTDEDVCPLYAPFVEVEFFIRNITTVVPITQLRFGVNVYLWYSMYIYAKGPRSKTKSCWTRRRKTPGAEVINFYFLYTGLCAHTSKVRPTIRTRRSWENSVPCHFYPMNKHNYLPIASHKWLADSWTENMCALVIVLKYFLLKIREAEKSDL